eukprot:TRINITY_DN4024_c0_g1_i1.p1 TRINITY_DN4024_c0_g1~~TRINITY_DN4024_c0_g1_i1.p1  ORF type:complete len:586 (+),score=174.17 TRINITY_DN4024_c0_g1_i1:73-1830(+)
MRLTTPLNQRRHNNVARVHITKQGRTFEIACYRNKVVAYRQGVETDRSSVLQVERVFVNVSRGEFAKVGDLREVLGKEVDSAKAMNSTEFERACVAYILDNGTMQVNRMERELEDDMLISDICTELAECGVHPQTRRPYPVSIIRAAVSTFGYRPHQRKPAKTQAHELLPKLNESGLIAIERARMRLRATVAGPSTQPLAAEVALLPGGCQVVEERSVGTEESPVHAIIFDIAPETYRAVADRVSKLSQDGTECSLQVLTRAVRFSEEGEVVAEMPVEAAEVVPTRKGYGGGGGGGAPALEKERPRRKETTEKAEPSVRPAQLDEALFAKGTAVRIGIDAKGPRGVVQRIVPGDSGGDLLAEVDVDGEVRRIPLQELTMAGDDAAADDAKGKKGKRRRQLEEAEQQDRLERRRAERERIEKEQYEEEELFEDRRARDMQARITTRDLVHFVVDIDEEGNLSLQADDDAGELREDLQLPQCQSLADAIRQAFDDAQGEADVRVAVRLTLRPGGVEAEPPRVAALVDEDGTVLVEEAEEAQQTDRTSAAPDGLSSPTPPAAAVDAPAKPARKRKGKGRRKGGDSDDD